MEGMTLEPYRAGIKIFPHEYPADWGALVGLVSNRLMPWCEGARNLEFGANPANSPEGCFVIWAEGEAERG